MFVCGFSIWLACFSAFGLKRWLAPGMSLRLLALAMLFSLLVIALMPSVQSFIRAVPLRWTHGGGHLEPTEHLLVEFLFDPVEVDDPAAWPFAVPTWNGFGLDATRLRALRTTYLVHTMHARACLCERAARA